MVQLDSINLRLLDLLQKDARTSIIDLARAVDRAESTVRERIGAMERDGVLHGYRALVDPERLGFRARAIVRANCDLRRVPDIAKRLAAIPQVTSVELASGAKPLVIEVVAEHLTKLEHVLEDRIAPLELEGVETSVVLRTLVAPRPVALHAAPAAAALPGSEPEASDVAAAVLLPRAAAADEERPRTPVPAAR
ncbi:MAG TPA: Lrp/AsnC family transcriptional regulator [Candidatus Thermoplasmatota archaeon]|jgi:Lrp/AsnC family transcriptional regulator for asnA, asnC and gidA|nr:Lrp/AsnC family transcriptional regulator [Candidatus Thermoplasmatota archaeon]